MKTGGNRPRQRLRRAERHHDQPGPSARPRWSWQTALLALAIFAISFATFAPALQNGFTNWDDPGYVTENTLIRDLSWRGIGTIFRTFVEGNYHPLTMLSLAVDYRLGGSGPQIFHLTNVLLNAGNAVLVFWFALLLTGSLPISTVAATFFGIHPLHVESVAWVSARKDLLYAMFFFSSCIAYLLAVRRERIRASGYVAALVLFCLALLSKGMAVTLPLTFVLIDWYRGRPLTARSVTEKTPFFLLAVVLGVVAIIAQRERGAIQQLTLYPFGERLLFASYGIVAYLFKALVPVRLAALYPYPSGDPRGLPFVYYAAPVAVLLLAWASYRFRRRAPLPVFGAAFFLLTVVLVLQLLPVGRAIIADRYTYVPYIGVGLALGNLFLLLAGKSSGRRIATAAVFLAFGTVLLVSSRARCAVWKDNTTLWDDEIRKYPNVGVAYNNLALVYKQRGDYELAMANLQRALEIDPHDADALSNRGNILFLTGRNESALITLERAVAANPKSSIALNSRGAAHFNRREFEDARADFDRALAVRPDYPEARLNRANVLSVLGRFREAVPDYDAYLRYDPRNARAYYWRGLARRQSGARDAAIEDFGRAMQLDPGMNEASLARTRALQDSARR
jgi:tetratricopeptide (TPR) repeat protein